MNNNAAKLKYARINKKIDDNSKFDLVTKCTSINDGVFSRSGNLKIPMAICPRTGKQRTLINMVWEQHYGPIDLEKEFVYRICGNTKCVNISHLRLANNDNRDSIQIEKEKYKKSVKDFIDGKADQFKNRKMSEILSKYGVSDIDNCIAEIMAIFEEASEVFKQA